MPCIVDVALNGPHPAERLPGGSLVTIALGAPTDATTLAEFGDPLDAAGVPWSVTLRMLGRPA